MLITIGIMVMIFCFSAQTRDKSNGLSEEITKILIKIKRWLDSFIPATGKKEEFTEGTYSLFDDLNHYVRKLAHLTEFAFLGAALLSHFKAWSTYLDNKFTLLKMLWALLVGMLYAATDEIHQLFVSGRGAQLKDVMIDSCGVLLGILILRLIILKCDRKRAGGASS